MILRINKYNVQILYMYTYMSDVNADTLASMRTKATARATTHDQPILGHLERNNIQFHSLRLILSMCVCSLL